MRELRAMAGYRHVAVHVCNQELCQRLAYGDDYCGRCREEIDALDALDEGAQQQCSATPRSAWRTQFFAALILMLLGEGLWNFALGLPINFRTVGISLGWALIVACVVALWHAWKKESK